MNIQQILGRPQWTAELDITPGRYGDWSRVMELIVVDTATQRDFYTLDGYFIGSYVRNEEEECPTTSTRGKPSD